MRSKIISSLIFLALFCNAALAQKDKAELENERRQLQAEIKEIQGVYSKLKKETNVSLGQANLLKRKIDLQEQMISSINKEIRFIDDDMYRSNVEIYRLEKQLDTLKGQYARSVVYAYKNRTNYDFLNFIFSADNFNDALKRISYLKSYRAYRQRQVENIKETKRQIEIKRQQMEGKKLNKVEVAKNQEAQVNELEVQKKEKDKVVAQLKAKEGDLKKQLTAKQKRDQQLKSQIKTIVDREIAAARERARKEKEERERREKEERDRIAEAERNKPKVTPPANPTGNTKPPVTKVDKVDVPAKTYKDLSGLNAADSKMAASFKDNRGRMPWPVDNGYVCQKFGKTHDEITKLDFVNPGITICTPNAGVSVKALFNGEVSSIFNTGDGYSVIIRHGNYYTVYSNLSSAGISKGAQVTTGQVIGRAGKNDDGDGGMIDLIMMQEKTEINPEPWLRR